MLTEPVTFLSEGLRIRGVFGRPVGNGKFPAYIDTHGAMSRGGDLGPPWTDLPPGSHLEALVESFAVLRVARRGYRGSEGISLPAYANRQVDGHRPSALEVFRAIQAESADGDQVTSWPILSRVWDDLAKELGMPVMILWAQNDVELEPGVGEALANALRLARRHVEHVVYPPFGENGHLLFVHPDGASVFFPDLLRFLDTNVRS